jgi:hypothetical protein
MQNLTIRLVMKKFLSFTTLILIVTFTNQMQAQYPKLEIKLSAVKETAPGKTDAEIHITTEGERPPYVYQLFDKAPWNGGKELAKSEKINESQFVFKGLKPGSYFVCVTDNEENSDCDIIQINND